MRYVLLPGLHGSAALFDPFVQAGPAATELILGSYPSSGPYDYDAAEVFARALLPRGESFVLIAESFSGPVALRIAADPPAGLRAVVLASSFARSPIALPLRSVPDAAFALLPMRSALPRWFLGGSERAEDWDARLREVLADVGQRAFVGRLRAIDGVDVRDLLPRVGVPLLYLQATRDRLVLPRFGREVTAGARDGRLIRLDGAHMLLQTAPQACWAAIASELYDRA